MASTGSTYAIKLDFDADELISPSNGSAKDITKSMPAEYKLYNLRWAILTIFVLFSASNAMQWIQYSIIADVITAYYNISSRTVDWTSMIYMVTYIPLIFPGSWLLNRLGLRFTTIAGAAGTCLGSWLKVLSIPQDLFWIGFLGQTIVGISQVFVLSIPARLAAVWFGPGQVSSACSIGVFGNQLGIALGFVLPPIIVKYHEDPTEIGNDLKIMFYSVAVFTSVLLVLIILFFKAAPPTPPSAAQDVDDSLGDNFLASIKRLILNRNYILLLISYGINTGTFYAISTLLNQVVLIYYPNANEDAGRIGLVMTFAGMAGSVLCGFILDKTHKFKETTFAVYAASAIGMVVYTFTLNTGYIAVVYFSSFLLGFFMTGYLAVGFEFAAEITYPEPEGTSAGLLNASAQIFGIMFTMLNSWLLEKWNDVWANVTLCVLMLFGLAATMMIKSDLRRQAAQIKT